MSGQERRGLYYALHGARVPVAPHHLLTLGNLQVPADVLDERSPGAVTSPGLAKNIDPVEAGLPVAPYPDLGEEALQCRRFAAHTWALDHQKRRQVGRVGEARLLADVRRPLLRSHIRHTPTPLRDSVRHYDRSL